MGHVVSLEAPSKVSAVQSGAVARGITDPGGTAIGLDDSLEIESMRWM